MRNDIFVLIALLAALVPVAAKWTVLVYLHGDNDLEYFSVQDLEEMTKAGS